MKRTGAILAATALMLATGLAACSSGGDYCATIKGLQSDKALQNTKMDDAASLDKGISALQKAADAAPADVKDDWTTVIDFLKKAKDAGKDKTKQAALAGEAGKFTPAITAIEKHAKDSCKVDLSK